MYAPQGRKRKEEKKTVDSKGITSKSITHRRRRRGHLHVKKNLIRRIRMRLVFTRRVLCFSTVVFGVFFSLNILNEENIRIRVYWTRTFTKIILFPRETNLYLQPSVVLMLVHLDTRWFLRLLALVPGLIRVIQTYSCKLCRFDVMSGNRQFRVAFENGTGNRTGDY